MMGMDNTHQFLLIGGALGVLCILAGRFAARRRRGGWGWVDGDKEGSASFL